MPLLVNGLRHGADECATPTLPASGHYPDTNRTWMADRVRVVDLCCGMGGLSVAAREMGMRVAAGVDLNPNALKTFGRNFPEAEAIEGSVRSGTVLERCRALLENVSTVLAEKHGDRLESFRQVLTEAGHHVEKKVLDSEYGVTRDALRGLPIPAVRPDIYDDEAEEEGPANHFAMRHSKRVMDKIAAIPPGTGPMSYRRLHPTKPANTLFSGHWAPPAQFAEPRSITVREAETVSVRVSKKRMPAHKVGRLWKFKLSRFDAWVQSGRAAAKSDRVKTGKAAQEEAP